MLLMELKNPWVVPGSVNFLPLASRGVEIEKGSTY
jgi:hypothetical protein